MRLAMDCGTLRRLTYSFAICFVLALAGIFLMDYEYVWIYSFAVSLIPASVMLTTLLNAIRCNRLSKTHPKETIVVGVKNAWDTLQLLELTATGRHMDSLVGTKKFCLQSKFMLFYGMTSFSILLLALPVMIPCISGGDANELSTTLTAVISFSFLIGFFVEYYTCCKAKYSAIRSRIFNAKIVRHPGVSYIELESEVKNWNNRPSN